MEPFKKLLKVTLILQILLTQNVNAQNTSIRTCTEEDRINIARMETELAKSNTQLIEAQRLLKIEKDNGKYLVNGFSTGAEKVGTVAAAIGLIAAFMARSNDGFMGAMKFFGLGTVIAASGAFVAWITDDPDSKISIEVLEKEIEKFTEHSQLLKIQLRNICDRK